MAPSVLLQPESPLPSYVHPAKPSPKPEGGVSLEVHPPAGGGYSFNGSSTNGNGHVNGGNGSSNSNGFEFSGRQGASNDFVTPQSLLDNSEAYGSQTQTQTSNGASKQPNILYIMADQMTASMLKMNDPNSVIKTPHLDELARTGVNFSSAYCNSPLCAPSRFTMCTGQLPSKIGGYDNASVLAPEELTYAHYLRLEGYKTALAGKMHFIGPDQLHGFEHR
jgi:hypothetical protein